MGQEVRIGENEDEPVQVAAYLCRVGWERGQFVDSIVSVGLRYSRRDREGRRFGILTWGMERERRE